MQKKNNNTSLYLFWWILVVILGGFLLWTGSQKKQLREQQELSMELASIQDTIDRSLLEKERGKSSMNTQGNEQKQGNHIDEMLQKIQVWNISATHEDHLKKISLAPANSFYQLSLIESLYESTYDQHLLPGLFSLSVVLRDFDKALKYLQILEQKDWGLSSVDVKTYLLALFNAVELDFSIFNRLKHIVDSYVTDWLLTKTDRDFYYSLITLARWDMENYGIYMENLRGSEYAWIVKKYDASVLRADEFVDTPEYYLQALVSVGMFQEWWYRISQHVARSIIEQDKKYLLWYQLDAYASLMLEDRAQAFESFDYLKSHDEPNKELYTFLWAITSYSLERYPETVLRLNQLVEQKNSLDVQRYRLLAYSKAWDIWGYSQTLRQLLKREKLYVHDYFSLFQELFFSDRDRSLRFIDTLTTDIDMLLEKCYEDMDNELVYICLYGKAWLYTILEDYDKVYQYLTRVVERYPHKDVYLLLWSTAYELWLQEEAVRWYIQSLWSTQDQSEYQSVKMLVKDIMMER